MSDPLATQPMLAPAAPGGRWLKVYFGTPGNTAITVVCAILIGLALKVALTWLLINAVFIGSPADCKAGSGACWPYLAAKLRYMLFGVYPMEEQWRPLVAVLIFLGALAVSGAPPATSR